MNKLLRAITALVLIASIAPAYAQESEKRTATQAQIKQHSRAVGLALFAGMTLGTFPSLAAGAVAAYKTYNALAPISPYVAAGVAIPSALIGAVATVAAFTLPALHLMVKYETIYDKESFATIVDESSETAFDLYMNTIAYCSIGTIVSCLSGAMALGILHYTQLVHC